MRIYIIALLVFANTCLSMNLRVDYSVFRYSDSLNLLELYYSFPDNALKYTALENYFSSNVIFEVKINNDKSVIDSVVWEQEIQSEKNINNYTTDLIGLKVILIPKGVFNLEFYGYANAKDKQSGNELFGKELKIKSPSFRKELVEISSIQIASVVEPEAKKTSNWSKSFLKNSLFVVPNPGADLIGDSIVLNCYFEIYNAVKNSPQGIDIIYSILDAGKNEVFHYSRKKKAYSDAMVEYISMPLNALPTGVYFLQVDLIPSNPDDKIKSEIKKFYVSNFGIPPKPITEFYESEQFEQSEFATLSEDNVMKHFAQIKMLASDYEIGIWDQCTTLGAKQRYLFTFWTNRNPDTTKPYNLALEEFREKVNYANKHFKYGINEEGWNTPRGRILLKYGHPNLIDRHEMTSSQPAYEIWKYDLLEGGAEFVFIDLKSNGYYQFVHSTIAGEIRNENWYEQYIEKKDPDPNFQYQKNPYR